MNIPTDKLIHALVGALIVALLWPLGPILAIGVALAAACGKELYDLAHRDEHTPDVKDAEVTVLGAVTAAAWLAGPIPFILSHL